MSDEEIAAIRASIGRQRLAFRIGQLRHAYTQLKAGTVKDQPQFADGLIAPAIRELERINSGVNRCADAPTV
jgi:hypothetical protein